jgi:N-acetylglucosamine-6-phosphate deacetylase
MAPQNDRPFKIRCPRIYTPDSVLTDSVLTIAGGRIAGIAPALDSADGEVIEETTAVVAPGFVDLHIHGARGRDVMDGTLDALEAMSSALAAHGTTAFLATTLSAPYSDTEHALRGYDAHHARVGEGARPIGIHMEGPYLNPVRRGTHDASYLRQADVPAFRRFLEISRGAVKKMTVAPEMDHGLELIRAAVASGVQISIGHSDATVEQARAAVDAGALHATHTFNAMRPFQQRDPGILGLVLTDDRVYAELIADGVHVHFAAVDLLLRAKGAERTILITDGLSAVDMPDGRYPLGDKTIVLQAGECHDADGRLAGSVLTLDRAVRNLVEILGIPLEKALSAASAVPARSMGMGAHKGVIAPGADADLVFLDEELRVMKTMVAGRIVYERR